MANVAVLEPIVRLTYREKPPVATMREVIQVCLQEKLTGAQYEGDKGSEISRILSDTIRNRLKGLGYDRYKFIVQVVLGERREQGVRSGTRCFWDSSTDNQASETFVNVSGRSVCLNTHFFPSFLIPSLPPCMYSKSG